MALLVQTALTARHRHPGPFPPNRPPPEREAVAVATKSPAATSPCLSLIGLITKLFTCCIHGQRTFQLAIEIISRQFKARRMKKKPLTARQFTKTTMNAWVARICTTGFWLNFFPFRCKRWQPKVITHMLQQAVVNAHILFRLKLGSPCSRLHSVRLRCGPSSWRRFPFTSDEMRFAQMQSLLFTLLSINLDGGGLINTRDALLCNNWHAHS